MYAEIIKKILSEYFSEIGFCGFSENLLLDGKTVENGFYGMIACVFPYDRYEGEIASYAQCRDYHITAKEKLESSCTALKSCFPGNTFRGFCDASPINEVKTAAICGLGVIGKNNMLITEKYGSFVHICVILTDIPFESTHSVAYCANCGRCVKACPTGALGKNGYDKSLCVSEITQKKGTLSEAETECLKKGNSIWGCDRCMNACPMNNGIEIKGKDVIYLSRDELEKMSNGEFKRKYGDFAFAWKGKSPLIRNIDIVRR